MHQQRILPPFRQFLQREQASGIILIVCTLFSLLIANTSFNRAYQAFWNYSIGLNWSFIAVQESLSYWINDGLMAIFFLVVGLEIKRELVQGELSTAKKAGLPLLAAAGGMVVPACIYSLFNHHTATANGWGIPMATDIAFALGILSLLGKRVPLSLKVFLTALAVIDDLGAIVVIALFYAQQIHWMYLSTAFAIFGILLCCNYLKLNSIPVYMILGLILWYCMLHSGVHAAIAGVLVAVCIPIGKKYGVAPLALLERKLHPFSAFLIMPLFALANTAIVLDVTFWQSYMQPLGYGILLGLVIGKPIGIVGFSYLFSRLRIVHLPTGTNWRSIIGIGLLGGIGFTMSIFITLIAFDTAAAQTAAKTVILTASILAGSFGYLLLSKN